MATSSVAICNSALIKCGVEIITALSDDNARAIAVNEQYDKCRRDILIDHPWNFAIGRLELAQNVTAPVNGFSYAYDLTSAVLRVLEVNDDDSIEWAVEGGQVVTDETTCIIKYIKDITDTTLFTKKFEEILALRIAADVCKTLTNDATHAKNLLDAYKDWLKNGRTLDAQEGNSNRQVIADTWLNSRF